MTLKKIAHVALVSLISLPTASFASTLTCSPFTGTLTLEPDPVCEITQLNARSKWFPDMTFLSDLGQANSCFTGAVSGMLGNEVMEGRSVSGQTLNAFPPLVDSGQLMFTAATVVKATGAQGKKLGNLYFRDIGMINLANGVAHEQLIIVGGSRQFRGARGSLTIEGNEFIGAPVTGQICVEVDED